MTTSGRARGLAVAGGVALAVLLLAPAVSGGSGIGAVLNLGRTNTVDRATNLSGSSATRMLRITNTGTGVALTLSTRAGVAPLAVTSAAQVANLNADLLDGRHAAAFVPADGALQVAVGNAAWTKYASADPVTVSFQTVGARWRSSSTGTAFLVATPDLPVALFGRAVALQAVELCFANGANTTLTNLELTVVTSTTGDATVVSAAIDATDRTGSGCTMLVPSSPVALSYLTGVTLYAQVNWGVASQDFTIRRTTFHLVPTGGAATAP